MRLPRFRRGGGGGSEPRTIAGAAHAAEASPDEANRPGNPLVQRTVRAGGRAAAAPARARRDRHGRGLRGPLSPLEVPLSRSRADTFADLVLDAVERLERRWARELSDVEFAVETVPPPARPGEDPPEGVPLSRLYPGAAGRDPRIVLYRRPVEARVGGRAELAALVHDLIVEQVAELLGREPEEIDPGFRLD